MWAIFNKMIMITIGITSTRILWTNIIFRIPSRITSRNLSISCRRRIRTIKISLRWWFPLQIIWWRMSWRLLFINFVKNNSSIFPFYIHVINFTMRFSISQINWTALSIVSGLKVFVSAACFTNVGSTTTNNCKYTTPLPFVWRKGICLIRSNRNTFAKILQRLIWSSCYLA